MTIDQRKAFLLASILLTAVRVHWAVEQVRLLATSNGFPSIYSFFLLFGNILFLLPLPILLFAVYQDGRPIALSFGIRRLAIVIALVLGSSALPLLYGGVVGKVVQDSAYLGDSPGKTVAEKLVFWLGAEVGVAGWPMLVQLSNLALVLAVASLTRHSAEQSLPDDRRSLRTIAEIAMLAAGLTVIISFVQQLLAAANYARRPIEWGGPSTPLFIALNFVKSLPELCIAIIPFIIYRSLAVAPSLGRQQSAEEGTSPTRVSRGSPYYRVRSKRL